MSNNVVVSNPIDLFWFDYFDVEFDYVKANVRLFWCRTDLPTFSRFLLRKNPISFIWFDYIKDNVRLFGSVLFFPQICLIFWIFFLIPHLVFFGKTKTKKNKKKEKDRKQEKERGPEGWESGTDVWADFTEERESSSVTPEGISVTPQIKGAKMQKQQGLKKKRQKSKDLGFFAGVVWKKGPTSYSLD